MEKVLNKGVCKTCRLNRGYKWDCNDGGVFDLWNEVWCPSKEDEGSPHMECWILGNRIPVGCPYRFEHTVLGKKTWLR